MVLSDEYVRVAYKSDDYNRLLEMGWRCVGVYDDEHGVTWAKMIGGRN